jgi:protein involved in polysaccharide export with SLBB domain
MENEELRLVRSISLASGLSDNNNDSLFVTVSRTIDGKEFTISHPLVDLLKATVKDVKLQPDDVINVSTEVPELLIQLQSVNQRIAAFKQAIETMRTFDAPSDAFANLLQTFKTELEELTVRRAELLPQPLPEPLSVLVSLDANDGSPVTPKDLLADTSDYRIGSRDRLTVSVFDFGGLRIRADHQRR